MSWWRFGRQRHRRPITPHTPGTRIASQPTSSPSRVSAAEELRVLAALNDIGADLGDPVDVSRDEEHGILKITGIGIGLARQQQIRTAVRDIAGVVVEFTESQPIETSSDRQPASQVMVMPRSAVHDELESHLGGGDRVERFVDTLLGESESALARAHALRKLANRFPPDLERTLAPPEHRALADLRARHLTALSSLSDSIKHRIVDVFGTVPRPAEIACGPNWQECTTAAVSASQKFDTLLNSALAGTGSQAPCRCRRPENDGRRMASANRGARANSHPMKLVLILLLCGVLHAQERAQLIGVIRDASGATVPGTEVSLYNIDVGVRRTTHTDDHGFYAVSSLRAGNYKITVRGPGSVTIARTGVLMSATEHARIDFLLEIGTTHEEITVQGDAEPITTNDATSLTILERDPIENLPLNNRGVQALTEFAPGLVLTPATRGEAGQFAANGQRPNTNYFTVDGVSVNNAISGSGLPGEFSAGTLPGMTAIGSLHGLVSALEVEEVRVQTSTFAPEFGRLPGAQISIVTRSGTNDFHGEFFGSLRPRHFSAVDSFSNRARLDPLRSQTQAAGGVLSGPLIRNRTFFVAGSEWLAVKQAAAWRIPVPTLETRNVSAGIGRSVLDAFPIPERSINGLAAEHTAQTAWPGRVWRQSIRVDHAIASNALLFVRYGHTFSESRAGYVQVNEARFPLDWRHHRPAECIRTQSYQRGADWHVCDRSRFQLAGPGVGWRATIRLGRPALQWHPRWAECLCTIGPWIWPIRFHRLGPEPPIALERG